MEHYYTNIKYVTRIKKNKKEGIHIGQSFALSDPAMFKAYPTPIAKPLWPMFLGAATTFWLFSKVADGLAATPEFKDDPRNPNAGKKH